MTPITDYWYIERKNEIGMISRCTMRRSLSLLLSLAIVLWADTGLTLRPASGHGSKCHLQMAQMHQHAPHSAKPAAAQSCWHQRAHTIPCCDLSSQTARPLAFLVASRSHLSAQLSAVGLASSALLSAKPKSGFFSTDDSAQFVRTVFQLKTDLRI